MLKIKKIHLNKFKKIKERFLSETKIPPENKWKSLTNNEIWLDLVKQIIVVGSSVPVVKFDKNLQLQRQITYETLIQIKNEEELKKTINRVLRTVGTRYASSDISKCRKTNALVHNLKVLQSFKNGPKGLLKKLSEFRGPYGDKRKVKYLMKIFKFIKDKSARDFLMALGLVKNTIALDVRIQNILRKIGIKTPEVYDEIEKDLLLKVCKPLGLSGVQFDRMLYQHYEDIKKML